MFSDALLTHFGWSTRHANPPNVNLIGWRSPIIVPFLISANQFEQMQTTWLNIHEFSSLLILSAFYTVLFSRIRIIIIIIIFLSVLLLFFPHFLKRNTE